MLKIGEHKIVGRDILALLAPFIICVVITYFTMHRLDLGGVMAGSVIFLIAFSPAVAMWLFRMRNHPKDPWKSKL